MSMQAKFPPIALKTDLVDGATVTGKINDIYVHGVVENNRVDLYKDTDGSRMKAQNICASVRRDGSGYRLQIYDDITENLTVRLSQRIESVRMTIPEDYLELEGIRRTVDAIRPNWKEANSASPRYIANRPFYLDLVKNEFSRRTMFQRKGDVYVSSEGGSLIFTADALFSVDDDEKAYMPILIAYTTNPKTPGFATGNLSLLARAGFNNMVTYPDGGELPNTGESWALAAIPPLTPGGAACLSQYAISEVAPEADMVIYRVTEHLKEIEEQFIPSTIQRVGGDVIVKSSTPGSTKNFKITVDDTGALTATEIT